MYSAVQILGYIYIWYGKGGDPCGWMESQSVCRLARNIDSISVSVGMYAVACM